MEKVAFIGGYDKTDIIFYIAKIIRTMGKKVLIVDATIPQKARYIIPTLTPALSYITTSDSVDFAIGFDSMEKLNTYIAEEKNLKYDYMLIDVDSKKRYKNFELTPEDKHYVVTNFDIYSLKKAVEVLKGIETKTPITKVYVSRSLTEEEDRYFRYITKDSNAMFRKEPVVFPIDIGDTEVIQKNQRDNIIRYKPLSSKYLYGIMYIAEEISGENSSTVKKALREIDR